MTFDTNLQSIEDGAPREGIEIKHGTTVYRIATSSRDVTINGNKFTASPAARGEVSIEMLQESDDLSITLPTSHAFVQRYNLAGNPPRVITCAVWQQRDGEARRIYEGLIESCEVASGQASGHVATFRMASTAGRATRRRLPVLTAGRRCPYVLYDANCLVSRPSFRQVTTVASHDGRTCVVASIGSFVDQYAQGGELLHVASGERVTISSQVGTTIVIQFPIVELRDGDAVHVFAGCAKDIFTCRDKFANLSNFGGLPELPTGNIFLPNGLGIYQSE